MERDTYIARRGDMAHDVKKLQELINQLLIRDIDQAYSIRCIASEIDYWSSKISAEAESLEVSMEGRS